MSSAPECRPFRVDVDGVTIVGDERGDPRRPTVVLLHGYPDDATVWDQVAPVLADSLHVVTYDVRGHGRSGDPADAAAYGFDHLMADLTAVLDRVSPDQPIHLVGHDWGAIQGWEAVARPDTARRIASFTAISAPSFDHAGWWMRHHLRAPTLAGSRDLLRQGRKSWYIAAFQVPAVPEAVLRTGILRRLSASLPAFDGLGGPADDPPGRLGRNAVNGVNLYRANLRRVRSPRRRRLHVPVQVLVSEDDAFVLPALFDDLERFAPQVVRRVVPGSRHWLPRTDPDEVVAAVSAFVEHVAAAASPGLPRTGDARAPRLTSRQARPGPDPPVERPGSTP